MMKTFRTILKVLMIAAAFLSVVFFFFPFVKMTLTDGTVVMLAGSQMCFGGSHEIAGAAAVNAKSLYFTFTFILAAFALLLAGFGFKKKPASIASSAFSLLTAIMFLTFLGGQVVDHVDPRIPPLTAETLQYDIYFYIVLFSLIGAVLIGIVTIFINDLVEVSESDGAKKPMLKRFMRWLLDYKSELKKIVWPTKQEVIKNTIIVLIMCLFIGGIVWALDFGLSNLLNLVVGIKTGSGS